MHFADIHTVIAELAGLYDDLNKRWSNDTCSTDVYQVYRQKEYKEAFDKLKAVNIESITLKVLADNVNDKVLGRLRGLIADNINIYETRRDEFNSIDFDKLYLLWEAHLFGLKRELLLKDKETIKGYPYPTERERDLLLKENQHDINELDNERGDLYKTDSPWIRQNYYGKIYDISRSFASILDSYFPAEKEIEPKSEPAPAHPEPTTVSPEPAKSAKAISPDEIFRSRMFDKFRELEARLIKDNYLDGSLNWLPEHRNGKPDIKRLVTFMTALLDNDYFMPNRDARIKKFFEARYHISIGQNFESKRRTPLLGEYKAVFYDYPF